MADDRVPGNSGIEKKGGYSGGRPAATVPPPSRLPSATIRPERDRRPQPA